MTNYTNLKSPKNLVLMTIHFLNILTNKLPDDDDDDERARELLQCYCMRLCLHIRE